MQRTDGSGARGSPGKGGHWTGGGQHTELPGRRDEHKRDPLSPEVGAAGLQAPDGRAPQTHDFSPQDRKWWSCGRPAPQPFPKKGISFWGCS